MGMANGNFFQNVIASLLGGNDPEAIKKRMLKNIAKNLSKTKFHFYKYSSDTIDISLPKFFYEIYKVISPAQIMFQNSNQTALKKAVINLSLTEKQLEYMDSFSEESIEAQSRDMEIKALQKKVLQDLNAFTASFDSNRITAVDATYTKLLLLSNFCTFDYYFLLKKFDSSLKEHDFNLQPKFQPSLKSSYISEDLKNFTAVAWTLPLEADWSDVFQLLKRLKGVEPITLNAWKKVLSRLKVIKERNVFEMMIQLISKNPGYKENIKGEEFHIMDDFISNVKKQAEEVVDSLKRKQTEGKIDGLLVQVFGTTSIDSLRNYNESSSGMFERKNFNGYIYCDPLRYLKQFLLDFTKRDMREISDILLVRGEWATQQLAKPMSEAYHQLLEVSENITVLDSKLAENGEYGVKLKTLLPRSDRDKEARNIINTVLGDANDEAARLITQAAKNYIVYDRNLKMALEDFVKVPHSELIINWKELDHFAEGNLKQMCVDAYKKIYLFVQLIQNFNISTREAEK